MTTYAHLVISGPAFLATEGGEATSQNEATTGTAEGDAAHENNFFYSDINEVIWGSVAFAVIVALFLWKGLAPIKRVMARRSQRIQDHIAQAEATRAGADAELAAVRTSLGTVDAEAARIVDEARARAATLKADLMARAATDVDEAKNRTRVEIEASKSQAFADLREEVVAMTIRATEAIVSSNLTESLRAELVDQYIDQVGASR
jgi:F-type H+-transporting ATPase subunit b